MVPRKRNSSGGKFATWFSITLRSPSSAAGKLISAAFASRFAAAITGTRSALVMSSALSERSCASGAASTTRSTSAVISGFGALNGMTAAAGFGGGMTSGCGEP